MGKLYFTCGDYISNSKGMDAIVNATNKYMAYGSGICGAIYNASGFELEEYCKNTYHEYMKNGEVRITSGFKLPMDIIHVLAPKFYEESDPINALMDCYDNLLQEIKIKGYKKVLLCSLGTGIHGYKHEDVAIPLVNLLSGFCKLNDVEIYFNNMYPLYQDIYLKHYLNINNLDLKNDLSKLNVEDMLNYLITNNLTENDIKSKYKNFVNNKDLEELCLSEKIICLQYTLENFKVSKDQVMILIESLGGKNE